MVYTVSLLDTLLLHHDIASLDASVVCRRNVKLYAPVMLQGSIPILHHGCVVNVDILPRLRGYEAVATLIVEPFNSPFHPIVAIS